ncbi:MAG: hypothetical protein JXL97_08495 [Bacteroidales bacterium]|nr:hypothetical protein [Bacteroidales bacterium]
MNKLKIVKLILKTSIFYSILRFFMLVIIGSSNLYDFFHFHFSNDLAWIFLTIIFPLFTSIVLSYKLNSKFLTDLGKLFLPLLIIISIIGYGFNKNNWGYIIKRPSVFSEVKNANELLSITRLEKQFDRSQFKILSDSIVTAP